MEGTIMKFEQVCQSGLAYFQQHPVFKVLLPISMPLMLGCAILRLVQNLISLGAFVSALVFLGFFLMMLLTLAQCNFRMVGIGFGLFALDYLWTFLSTLIKYHSLAYGSLLYLVVYGGMAFLSYKKSVSFNS
jgi:hypothetical protein